MRWFDLSLVGAVALVAAAPALAYDTTSFDSATKPTTALRATHQTKSFRVASPDEFARWDAAQTKAPARLARAEQDRRVRSEWIVAPPGTALADCMGTKATAWTNNRCSERMEELGAASIRP